MKNDQILNSRVRYIVAEALNLEYKEVSSKAVQEDFSEWDSMTYLTILSIIEDEFDISISSENIDNFGGITHIINEINKCQKK